MFSRKLYKNDPSKATQKPDPKNPNYLMGDFGYGKNGFKILQLKKDGPIHTVIEYKVNLHMRLTSHQEIYDADNSNIIGSDVMETTAYIHAQKYGLSTPEEYALSLSRFFLNTYERALECNVIIEVMGWDRLGQNESHGMYKNDPHPHTFLQNKNGRRRCEVVRKRNEAKPLLIGGITELRMLKSGCAPYVGYSRNVLNYEGDNPDRVLCVDVDAKWEYKNVDNIDFTTHWYRVRDILMHSFAGDSTKGTPITSVQYYCYQSEVAIMEAMPELCSVSVNLKNIPQVPYDFKRIPPFEPKADVLIIQPVEDPHSVSYVNTDRLQHSNL